MCQFLPLTKLIPLLLQLQSLQKEADESMAALTRERDQALKSNADLRRRHEHFQHEIRRKEQEYERLQACLAGRLFAAEAAHREAGVSVGQAAFKLPIYCCMHAQFVAMKLFMLTSSLMQSILLLPPYPALPCNACHVYSMMTAAHLPQRDTCLLLPFAGTTSRCM